MQYLKALAMVAKDEASMQGLKNMLELLSEDYWTRDTIDLVYHEQRQNPRRQLEVLTGEDIALTLHALWCLLQAYVHLARSEAVKNTKCPKKKQKFFAKLYLGACEAMCLLSRFKVIG